MTTLYAATELGTDLQALGFLGHSEPSDARMIAFRKALAFDLPRAARWLVRVAAERQMGKAELCGWIVNGEQIAEPAGLPTLLRNGKVGPDGLPSARYGGLLRLGQTGNGDLWGADLHRKAVPVYVLDPGPDGFRHGWRRRFDRLDDFSFYAAKSTLCQRDRITLEELFDLARIRGVRPEELVPDALEDEKGTLNRLALRRAKKVSPIANRFLWLDVLLVGTHLEQPTPMDIARSFVDHNKLHQLSEDAERMTDPSVACFWMFRHALFSDEAAYKKTRQKAGNHPLVQLADAECKTWGDKKKAPFDRKAVAKAILIRAAKR